MIKVKYFNEDYPRIERLVQGDWIDLRVDGVENLETDNEYTRIDGDSLYYHAGDVITFNLGVAVELPSGYEAIIASRSSTFKYWGLMQTNGIGVIDNSYCGDSDEWMVQMVALKDGIIDRFDRVCQFRVLANQPRLEILETDRLGNDDRGGYGTTGKGDIKC